MTTEQWLRGSGKLRARDLPGGRFLANGRHHQFDDDQLCLWPRGSAEVFEYGEAVLVRPVVQYFGEYEDGDVLLLCGLRCKEVLTFLRTQNVSFVPRKQKMTDLGFAHGQIQVPRAYLSSRTVVTDIQSIYWL
jgi:hypothetical protein